MSSPATPEADHLRWIVEKQPSCLMRIGADSVVLAANDAALALFGAERASQVLGTSLTGFVAASHRDIWLGFVAKVTAGSPHSLECVLNDVSSSERHVVLHGVPLLDHADGIRSVLLSIRDNNAIRRMEAALHETEQLRQQAVMSNPQDARRIEELQTTIAELQAHRDQLERSVAELPRLQQLLKQGRTYLQDMQTRLAAATKERDTLAQQLSERAAPPQQTSDGLVDLRRSLAEAISQRDAALAAREAASAQSDAASAQRDALSAQLAERDAAHQQLWADQEAQHKALVEAHERDVEGLRRQLDERAGERADLEKRLCDAEAMCAHLRREREDAEAHVTSHVQRINVLEGRLERALQDHEQLSGDLAKRVQEHETAIAAAGERHQTEIEALRQDLAAAHAQIAQERSTIDALNAAVADERAQVSAANDRLAETQARVDASERSLAETRSGLESAQATLADERSASEALRRELTDERSTIDALRRELSDERSTIDALRRELSDERTTIDALRHELAEAVSDRDRVRAELTALDAARTQQAQDHEADRARLDRERASALAQLNEAEKALSDNRLELQSMDGVVRQIEPLAAAGRVAAEAAREILAAIGDIDARTACLAAESATDGSAREQIEQLRADAVRAASLARQIVHASRIGQAEERHADSA
jgi:chromosome segregation ATPase